MKKLFCLFIFALTTSLAIAQPIKGSVYDDDMLPSWFFDVNLKGGVFQQTFTNLDMTANFPLVLNDTISALKFGKGYSYGFDAKVGYFWDKKKHLGFGIGFMYQHAQSEYTLDKYRLEYRSTDFNNDTFRQIVTLTNPLTENVKTSNFSIPVVFIYKKQISPKLGISFEIGPLLSLQLSNNYSTNAAFNYEAIYKYKKVGNSYVPVYDSAATPASTDLIQTAAQISKSNNDIQTYFDVLHSQGYNVGLAKAPAYTSGSVNFEANLGFLIQPSLTYRLNDNVMLNVGFYIISQSFDNLSNSGTFKLTDNVGSYQSVMNSINSVNNLSYGANIGLRVLFDKEMLKFQYRAKITGKVPDPTYTYVKDSVVATKQWFAKTIYMDANAQLINKESEQKLQDIVKFLKNNPNSRLILEGYTDNTGESSDNKALSLEYAKLVQKYLIANGIAESRIPVIGKGELNPIGDNSTEEGRNKNRRVRIELIE
jgi:outer membrane protein OmpA-like peptidoglycan-associated protein